MPTNRSLISELGAGPVAPTLDLPPQQVVLGVPLAVTDYDRTLDWIDAAVALGAR